MHLFELVDSSPYTVTTDDATNFLEQLERIWPRDELHRRLDTVTPRSPCLPSPLWHLSLHSRRRSVRPVRAIERHPVVAQ
jgi:hypothetical protein